MKQIRILLAFILSSILFSACKNEDPPLGFPMYDHVLRVTFVDEDGNNPIPSLEFCNSKNPYIPVEPNMSSIYANNWVMDKYFRFYMNAENLNIGDLTGSLRAVWIDDIAYLNFQFTNGHHQLPVVDMELTCEKIFGDNDRHVMVAEYGVKHFNDENQIECVRFTLDGVEYPVKAGGLVTVPLGR